MVHLQLDNSVSHWKRNCEERVYNSFVSNKTVAISVLGGYQLAVTDLVSRL